MVYSEKIPRIRKNETNRRHSDSEEIAKRKKQGNEKRVHEQRRVGEEWHILAEARVHERRTGRRRREEDRSGGDGARVEQGVDGAREERRRRHTSCSFVEATECHDLAE